MNQFPEYSCCPLALHFKQKVQVVCYSTLICVSERYRLSRQELANVSTGVQHTSAPELRGPRAQRGARGAWRSWRRRGPGLGTGGALQDTQAQRVHSGLGKSMCDARAARRGSQSARVDMTRAGQWGVDEGFRHWLSLSVTSGPEPEAQGCQLVGC